MNNRICFIFIFSLLLIMEFLPMWSHDAHAMNAKIISLEAPLFVDNNIHSTIIRRLRKGDEIFIHDNEFGAAPHESDYEGQEFYERREELLSLYYNPTKHKKNKIVKKYIFPNIFYMTMDRNGKVGYIQGKHFKVLYEDTRELSDNTAWPHWDVTDYRIPEPIGEHYPFIGFEHYRVVAAFGYSPQTPPRYAYKSNPYFERYGMRGGFHLNYLKNTSVDKTNRFFFGGTFTYFTGRKDFGLNNDSQGQEVKIVFSLGPVANYHFYQHENLALEFYLGVMFNYDRTFIKMYQTVSGIEYTEERLFPGVFLSLKTGLGLRYATGLKGVDLYTGLDVDFNHPYSITNNSKLNRPWLWNQNYEDENSISYGPTGNLSLYIGMSARR